MEFNSRLQCNVVSFTCDYDSHVTIFFLAEDECCSMNGAIAVATQADDQVRAIQTYSGTVLDTRYVKRRDGTWLALIPML